MGVIKFPTPGSQYDLNIAAHITSQNIVMKHSPKAFKGHWKEGNDVPLQNEQFFSSFWGNWWLVFSYNIMQANACVHQYQKERDHKTEAILGKYFRVYFQKEDWVATDELLICSLFRVCARDCHRAHGHSHLCIFCLRSPERGSVSLLCAPFRYLYVRSCSSVSSRGEKLSLPATFPRDARPIAPFWNVNCKTSDKSSSALLSEEVFYHSREDNFTIPGILLPTIQWTLSLPFADGQTEEEGWEMDCSTSWSWWVLPSQVPDLLHNTAAPSRGSFLGNIPVALHRPLKPNLEKTCVRNFSLVANLLLPSTENSLSLSSFLYSVKLLFFCVLHTMQIMM